MSLFEVTIEVTQRCPNRCIYCSSVSGLDKTDSLEQTVIFQVIDDAAALGARQINLSGGEPLLRLDIVDIATYIKSKGIQTTRLYTSGVYYNGASTSIPLELLLALKYKVDTLIFNYETADPKLYAKIMGTVPENLELVDESIRTAISVGIPVEAHVVPMACNFRQIPLTLERLYSMGVSKVSLLRFVEQGRATENVEETTLSSGEQEELREMIKTLANKYGDKLRLGKPYRSEKYFPCYTGTVRLAVRYDGYVFPCGVRGTYSG